MPGGFIPAPPGGLIPGPPGAEVIPGTLLSGPLDMLLGELNALKLFNAKAGFMAANDAEDAELVAPIPRPWPLFVPRDKPAAFASKLPAGPPKSPAASVAFVSAIFLITFAASSTLLADEPPPPQVANAKALALAAAAATSGSSPGGSGGFMSFGGPGLNNSPAMPGTGLFLSWINFCCAASAAWMDVIPPGPGLCNAALMGSGSCPADRKSVV